MFSVNILTAQPWAGKGLFPVSLLWTNPGCSYNPALKNEHLGGSQMFYQYRAALFAACLQGSFQLWGASARLLLDMCTHPGQTQLKCHQLSYSFSDHLKSAEPTLWNHYPSTGKSGQVLMTESRGQLPPVVGSEKIQNFKANLYRLTPERCWTSATSENEGCKSLSTYLKNSNIDLILLNNYMTVQKFFIIRSRA